VCSPGRNTRSSRNRQGRNAARRVAVLADGAQHFFDQNHVAGHEVELQQGRMLLGDKRAHGREQEGVDASIVTEA